jgi:flagellar biosynthesis/type III secretory pathway M-ring protein FliF/YscJ
LRNWLQLLMVVGVCSLCFGRQVPEELSPEGKAQRLVDQIFGPGHAQVTVTVKRAKGQRTVRSTTLGDEGKVVARQTTREEYQKAQCDPCVKDDDECYDSEGSQSKGNYANEKSSEKFELSREVTVRSETEWIERTSVAVVVDCEPTCELEDAIAAGLGLDVDHGDLVQLIRRVHP